MDHGFGEAEGGTIRKQIHNFLFSIEKSLCLAGKKIRKVELWIFSLGLHEH